MGFILLLSRSQGENKNIASTIVIGGRDCYTENAYF
jgi:hypothetical protein